MNKERITDAELSEIRERADKDTGSVADYGPGTLSLRREIVRQDVPKLLAEIERLRAENDRLCPIGDLDTITTLRTEIEYRDDIIADKDGELERYRKALEFYADRRNWNENATAKGPYGETLDFGYTAIQIDEGMEAIMALGRDSDE